jgi:sortase A
MQRAWSKADNGVRQPPPWPWADTWPVARLTAKGGDVELIVLSGGSGRTLAFGPGHLSISALPGEIGNSVIAGHRDTHFQFLQHVKVGEVIDLEMPDGRGHRYRVSSIDVVDARRGSLVLDIDTPVLSLVTCYPFSALGTEGSMRYVVSAEMLY